MITIDEQTLKELVLRTEPGFFTQHELEANGYGVTKKFSEDEESDYTWVWSKERIRSASTADLNYLITKIVE